MKADISRTTFRRNLHYSGVRLQQGRVQVDADFNEQVDIGAHRDRETTRDVVGPDGAPKDGGGFQIGLGDLIESVAFPIAGGNRGVAVGPRGTMLATSDGTNWVASAEAEGADLHGAYMIDATHAWAVGSGAKILAGNPTSGVWSPQTTPAGVTADLLDVHFTTVSKGWAVGEGATILVTENGGGQWSPQTAPAGVTQSLHAIRFAGPNRGFAVGDEGRIVKFESAAWTAQAVPEGFEANLRAVFFRDATNGCAVGEGAAILVTGNAGANWVEVDAPAGVTATLRAVWSTSASEWWAAGDGATVLRSTDSGSSWDVVPPPEGLAADLHSLTPRGASMLAVGDLSTIALIPATGAWTLHDAPKSARDLTVSAGHMYVGGVLCENERTVRLSAQPDKHGDPTPQVGSNLLYLDVWERHRTALDDPLLRETALGGPDHATRTQTVWQVKLATPPAGATCETLPADWTPPGTESTARLRARAQPAAVETGECLVPAGGGYRRLENQLYRVEVHDPATGLYKWSRDNGSMVARVEGIDPEPGTSHAKGKLTFSEPVGGFAAEGYVELSDDSRVLRNEPGILLEVDVIVDATTITWKNYAGDPFELSDFDAASATVRRWDGRDTAEPGQFKELEAGVWIELDGTAQPGDYWTIPARTLKAEVQWPTEGGVPAFRPREGVQHRYAPLGFVEWEAGGSFSKLVDCRDLFPPLTDITADDVSYDPAQCKDLANAKTVQEAIDGLCARPTGGTGTCTVSAFPGDDLQSAVESLPETGGELCLAAGVFELDKPLKLVDRRRVQITGRGPATVVRAANDAVAIAVVGCDGVTLRSLRAEASGDEKERSDKSLPGTVTFQNSTKALVVDCELTCEMAARRAHACLTFVGGRDDEGAGKRVPEGPGKRVPALKGTLRVERSRFEIGAFQAGIHVLNPEEVVVKGNHVSMRATSAGWRAPGELVKYEMTLIEAQAEELANVLKLLVRGQVGPDLPPEKQPTQISAPFAKERPVAGPAPREKAPPPVARPAPPEKAPPPVARPAPPEKAPVSAQFGRELEFIVADMRRRMDRGLDLTAAIKEHAQSIAAGEVPDPSPDDPAMKGPERAVALAKLARALRAAGKGIEVTGEAIGTVQILDNIVEDVIQGIFVGLADSKGSRGESQSEAMVSRNVVHSLVPDTWEDPRHAVFVGGMDSTSVLDTTATLRLSSEKAGLRELTPKLRGERPAVRGEGEALDVVGIHVWGDIGRYMVVRHSSLRGYSTGVKVDPTSEAGIGKDGRGQLWLVAETMARGASVPVDAPDSVEVDRPYPS